MTETTVTKRLRLELAKLGAMTEKLHGSEFSRGLPDLLVSYNGRMGLVEVKVGDRALTDLQKSSLQRLRPSAVLRFWAEGWTISLTAPSIDGAGCGVQRAAEVLLSCLFQS